MNIAQKILRALTLFLALVIVALFFWRPEGGGKKGPLPSPGSLKDYGSVADFDLTDQRHERWGRADLMGKVWVANFIFTRCQGPCPILSKKMLGLQEKFKDQKEPLFVSFSVDPAYDTPDVLTRYAKRFGVKGDRWHFLTGKEEAMHRLVTKSFHLAVGKDQDSHTPHEQKMIHSTSFVLVDREGRIRGYYTGTHEEELAQLEKDMKRLMLAGNT